MYGNFEEFWPFYVGEHLKPSTRVWHMIGSGAAVLLLLFLLVQQAWGWLPLVLVLGYGPAWYSHFVIEKNRPATFKYPLWSLRADFRMFRYMLLGKMADEVERIHKKV